MKLNLDESVRQAGQVLERVLFKRPVCSKMQKEICFERSATIANKKLFIKM